MKKLITILTFVLSVMGFAQISIDGTVIDNNGEPIIGANVYLEGTYDGSTTDELGKFSFSTEETGNHFQMAR